MRRPHATIKFNFLGAGLEREPGCAAIAASVRRRTNGSFPPIDRTRRRRRTSDAREHATTSLVFGGWRRESDDRESDERKGDGRNKQRSCDHGDREDDKKKKGQLANKPRERRGVRRTSHARRELCELKRRGASRSYRRVDGRRRRLARRP